MNRETGGERHEAEHRREGEGEGEGEKNTTQNPRSGRQRRCRTACRGRRLPRRWRHDFLVHQAPCGGAPQGRPKRVIVRTWGGSLAPPRPRASHTTQEHRRAGVSLMNSTALVAGFARTIGVGGESAGPSHFEDGRRQWWRLGARGVCAARTNRPRRCVLRSKTSPFPLPPPPFPLSTLPPCLTPDFGFPSAYP